MSRRLGPGIMINNNNSNSNNNSNNSNTNSNSNNNSLFSRNSNNSSNNSSSNENEWEEAMNNTNSPKPHSKLRFAKTRKVKRINQSGKSREVGKGHRTKTKRHIGTNVNVSANVSRNRYAAARLVAAAHKQSYSYDEMKEFIDRARTSASVKALALRKIRMKYPDFGK